MPDRALSFSVVIPTYNRDVSTERAIQSCLAQRDKPLEIIVVDDNSADPFTWSGNPCVRVIRHERNYGGGRARNTGIDAAGGDLICFLDSDDLWLPEKLSEVRRALEGAETIGDLVIFHEVTIVKDAKVNWRFRNPPIKAAEDILGYQFVRGGLAQTSTLCVPRALARRVRFSDTLRIHQDLDFCLRLQMAGARFHLIPQPLSVWHWGGKDRVSEAASAAASLAWVRSLEGRVSEKTLWAIKALLVAPKLRAADPEAALACLVSAWRIGAFGSIRTLRRMWRLGFLSLEGIRLIWNLKARHRIHSGEASR